jgi:hypothetical protein
MAGLIDDAVQQGQQAEGLMAESAKQSARQFEQKLKQQQLNKELIAGAVGEGIGLKKGLSAKPQEDASSTQPKSTPAGAPDPDMHSQLIGSFIKKLWGGLFNKPPSQAGGP